MEHFGNELRAARRAGISVMPTVMPGAARTTAFEARAGVRRSHAPRPQRIPRGWPHGPLRFPRFLPRRAPKLPPDEFPRPLRRLHPFLPRLLPLRTPHRRRRRRRLRLPESLRALLQRFRKRARRTDLRSDRRHWARVRIRFRPNRVTIRRTGALQWKVFPPRLGLLPRLALLLPFRHRPAANWAN